MIYSLSPYQDCLSVVVDVVSQKATSTSLEELEAGKFRGASGPPLKGSRTNDYSSNRLGRLIPLQPEIPT